MGLEPVGEQVTEASSSTSKSAVSRKFVAMTEHALTELLAADLSTLDLGAFIATGCTSPSTAASWRSGSASTLAMHPLALVEGGAENATLVTELIVGLRERGLDVTRPVLAVLDGSKALRRAVLAVFDHPVLARCQLHKLRNVKNKLPGVIVKTWCATNAGGRDEWVIVGDGGAVQPMKVGPSESPCGGRLQTSSCCAGREAGVVSDEEKAPVRRQVGTRKANVSESLWTCRDD